MSPYKLAGLVVGCLLAWLFVGSGAALVAVVAVGLAWWFGVWTSRKVEARIQSQRTVDSDLLPPGAWFSVNTHIKAEGVFRFRWYRVFDKQSPLAVVAGSSGGLEIGGRAESYERNYRVSFPRRGSYELGPAEVEYGDLFGIGRQSLSDIATARVDVHPTVVRLPELRLPSNVPYGGHATRRSEFEDLSRTVGSRDYVPGDPLKRIHWKATAQRGSLMVREYEGSTAPVFAVTIDRNPAHFADTDAMEAAFSACASVFCNLLDQAPTALRVDEFIGPNQGALHREAGLRALARAGDSPNPLGIQVVHVATPWPWRSTIVVVVSKVEFEDLAAFEMLRRKGHRVALVFTDRRAATPAAMASSDAFAFASSPHELANLQFHSL